MKKLLILVIGLLMLSGCATYNSQAGAGIGGSLGAIAGQVIARSTQGTLIGAAAGMLVGAIAGDAIDKHNSDQRMKALEESKSKKSQQSVAYAIPVNSDEIPPGQWVEEKGKWNNGQWVPRHKVWQPINPEEEQ